MINVYIHLSNTDNLVSGMEGGEREGGGEDGRGVWSLRIILDTS